MEINEEQPILAEPHFYWSSCSVCLKTSSKTAPMKKCTRCQSMYYCGAQHQKVHWKKHKNLCNYLANAAIQGDLVNFFSGHEGQERTHWNQFRMNAVKMCSIVLSRPLTLQEQEMFLFPRVCREPNCHSTGNLAQLQDCQSCFCVSWCSDAHKEEMLEEHEKVCRELRLARVADRYESQVRVGLPSIPSSLDKEFFGTAPDITHFIDKPWPSKDEISEEELNFAFLTNHLSGPLTLLNVASRYLEDFKSKDILNIHVAGANLYEMIGIIKWEYLAHRLPNLKHISFLFVGPELEDESNEHVPIPQCEDCTSKGRTVSFSTLSSTYNTVRCNSRYSIPDLVLVQNCGFHEYPDEVGCKEWEEGWAGLNHLLYDNSLLIFTSYTKGEAELDLSRFLTHCTKDVEVLIRTEENPMRSHRPIRDWEQDRDKDVFYSNQYLSVVKKVKV